MVEQSIPLIVLLSILLLAIAWCIPIYRRNLQEIVNQSSSQLKQLEQELERAEREAVKYRGTQQKLGVAVASLEYTELTATTTEKAFKDLCTVPVPALPNIAESTTQIMQRLADTMYILNKHGVALAGIEQVLLAVEGMPKADMLGHMVLSYYTGILPAGLQEPAKEVINNIVSGHLDNLGPLVSTASGIMQGVVHLYQTNPGEVVSLVTHLGSGESLVTHLLDGPHLEVYAHGLAGLADHLTTGHELLSHASHLQHADHLGASAGNLDHAAGGFDIHIPWITMALSVSREVSLLVTHKTTAGTSLKNAGLDVAGAGVGGTVGGAIGSVIFPGVGTVIGGALGAMLGRHMTNKIKMQPLEDAQEALNMSVEALKTGERNAANRAARNVNTVANQKRLQVELQIGPMPQLERYLKQQLIDDADSLCLKASAYIQNALAYINKASEYAGQHWYRGLLLMLDPNVAQLTKQLALVEGCVRKAEQTLPSHNDVQRKPVEALEQLSRLSIPLPNYNVCLEDASTRARDAVEPYRKRVIQWCHDAASAFPPVADELKPVIEQAFQTYKRECDTLLRNVENAVNDVSIEKQKLGLE